MYSKTAKYYDDIYASIDKDYAAEAGKLRRLIQMHKTSKGNSLLNIACGTGVHAGLLTKYYQVQGLDVDPKMLFIARKKHPGIRFHRGDMTDFDLQRQFDVVVCLFSSIGYVKTKPRLQRAIKKMSEHLLPGGVLLIEPWFTPDQWYSGRSSITQVNRPELKIVRMSYGRQTGKISTLEFHYMIGTSKGIKHTMEIHKLGLFTDEEYTAAFKTAGLDVTHDSEGLDGRGLYIGINQQQRQ